MAVAVGEHDALEQEEIVLVAVPELGHEGVQHCDQLGLEPLEVSVDHAGVAPGIVVLAVGRS